MKKGLFVIIGVLWLMACGDGNVFIATDPDIQLAEDSVLIKSFFEAKGLTDFETTERGVRYAILDEGVGEKISESDIVTFDYIGMLAEETIIDGDTIIFDTSIKAVGDSIRAHFLVDSVGMEDKTIPELLLFTYTESRIYSPFIITYASSGWTVEGQFVPGFSDGITQTFNQMGIEGRALIAMPSSLAYGTFPQGSLIPANSVLVFELRPTSVIEQVP